MSLINMGWLCNLFCVLPPLFSFNCSKQGYSHIKDNKICQDYSGYYKEESFATAVVSDGHGGSQYFRSDIGSRLAVEVTIQCIKEFVAVFFKENQIDEQMLSSFKDNSEKYIEQLEKSILARWRNQVNEHYSKNPFSNEELDKTKETEDKLQTNYVKAYGATLISITVVKDYFWFGLQIGDGRCVTINNQNKTEQPIPKNEKCFLNTTTSLCDNEPLKEFRHFFDERIPKWIFVGTDGIEDCFNNDSGLNDFYLEIARLFKKRGADRALQELEEFLPSLSQRGSGDDVSIAGIYKR